MLLYLLMAEREGFEPSVYYYTHDFQSCTFDHSVTSPKRMAERVGFEPTVSASLQ
jgi:hypothetical protein